MAKSISRRPPIEKTRFQCQANPCGICGGPRDTETNLSLNTLVLHQHSSINGPYSEFITDAIY